MADYSFIVGVLVSAFVMCSGYLVDDSVGLGRRFDGIGGLSGGGATSKLLVNYQEPQRSNILDYLFKPNFGASLQILKVEIGGDAQSTDGTESSHMHESWDENYQRGYEWWLMVQAKKRNPAIKLYALPWAFPGWVGRGTGDPYKFPGDTAMYVVKWLLAAKRIYNLDIDYVGIWNERDYSTVYIETLKSMLIQNGLSGVQVVAADGDWGVSDDVLKNVTFAAAVDVIGGLEDVVEIRDMSSVRRKRRTFQVERSEAAIIRELSQVLLLSKPINPFGLQKTIVHSMTMLVLVVGLGTISWNLIASYYERLPFGRDALMTAEEPWSGHYVIDNPIWVTAHTTQFTEIGWNYLTHNSGVGLLDYGGSYVSLLSPDKQNFTMVIETMSHDHSICIRPGLPPYKVVSQQAEFRLDGTLAAFKNLYLWKTSLGYNGQISTVFERQASIKPYMGMFSINLDPDQIYTITTMKTGIKGAYPEPPDSKPFPLPYDDTYESYDEFSEAFNFVPQSGVWEVRKSNDPEHGMINRQVLLNDPIYWCSTKGATLNLGGDDQWADVVVRSDILVPSVNGTETGVFVSARIDRGGCDAGHAWGVFFIIYPGNSSYLVTANLARAYVLTSGSLPTPLKKDAWYRLSLIVHKNDAFGLVDKDYVFHASLPANVTRGFAGYGTTSLGYADFDNLAVSSSASFHHHTRDLNVVPMFEIERQKL